MKAGDLVEAKGPTYAHLLARKFGDGVMAELLKQARREKAVADARGVGLKYYFAEEQTANLFRDKLGEEKLDGMVVAHLAPRKRK